MRALRRPFPHSTPAGTAGSIAVHSRSQGPVDELVGLGAVRCAAPAEVAAASEIVITMLPDTPDVESVVYGPSGLSDAARPGLLVIDMSTIDPIATRRIGADLVSRGVGFIDAPVSGGEKGAIDAALSIMIGGSEEDVARALRSSRSSERRSRTSVRSAPAR